jgi:predicted tellurium resistance membrane protein TerC
MKDPDDRQFLAGIAILFFVGVSLILLMEGPEVADLVGGVLGLVGAVPSAPALPANAGRVASFAWFAQAAGLVFAGSKIVGWVEQGGKTSWTNREDGRAWAALLMGLGLCAALGVGATVVFQVAAGLPVHLTPQAALAGLPFALLVVLGVIFLLAS